MKNYIKNSKLGSSVDLSKLNIINESHLESTLEETSRNSFNLGQTYARDSTTPFTMDSSKLKEFEAIGSQPVPNYTIPEYSETSITPLHYFKNITRDPLHRSKDYVVNLFPIFKWIGYYPSQPKWILSDFITGVSVAIVLVPQAMSYAKLAGLQPEYGLYSSFIGLMMYAIFATSKDISIGPVAVMSLEVSKIINKIQDKYGDIYTAAEVGTTLALLCGAITLGVGLLRLGFLVELIPLPAVMAFTTGSAFNIITSQLPGLFGYADKVNNHTAPYLIVINFLKNLKNTKVDAAFGLTGLFILYLWKYFSQKMIERQPKYSLLWTYVLNLRTAIVIIFSTLISFLIVRHDKNNSPFSITGEVKSGLENVGRFIPPAELAARIAPDLPVATIVLVLEHISIAKSFGRLHDYKIDPNQEFIAIGVTNLVGTFFSAYPATGSFSRTALASKCGVKTPFASIFAGFCVLVAIYAFTSAFFYIPKATLCAIIIHAVSDLMASYKSTLKMYLISPIDCAIFIIGVFIAVFASIEYGIYFAMCAAAAMILWRMCWTNGAFLGRIRVVELVDPMLTSAYPAPDSLDSKDHDENEEKAFLNSGLISMADSYMSSRSHSKGNYHESTHSLTEKNVVQYNYKWVPASKSIYNSSKIHTRYINDNIMIESPPPGVVVYRMNESFIYPNSSAQTDNILDYVKKHMHASGKKREVLWNNISETKKPVWSFSWSNKKKKQSEESSDESNSSVMEKPVLKVVHLDFSQVVAIDATSIQALIDMKRAISLFTNSEFEIHFSGIISPWIIRGLVNAGFGGKASKVQDNEIEVDLEEDRFNEEENTHLDDLESGEEINKYVSAAFDENGILHPIFSTDLPHFHLDIPSYSEYD